MGRYTLTDQAGNIAQVIINAPIDITAPTLTVTAYQSDSAQKAPVGSSVGAITANKDSPDVTLSTYKNAVNGWLNKTNYPYGVYYQIAFSDNLGLKERIWQWNDVGKTSSNVGNEYDSATSPTTGVAITGKNGTHAVSLAGEGYRKGLYKVTDQAGNTATVKVNAPIDRTAPTNTTSTVRYIEATGTLGAIRSGSDQTVSTRRLWWGDFKATEAISGISHHEYSSGCTGPASRLYPPYNYPQNDAKTQNWSFCIRTVDNAGNAGAWSSKYYFNIKLP